MRSSPWRRARRRPPSACFRRSSDATRKLFRQSCRQGHRRLAIFYEALGFRQVFGNEAEHGLILQNATATIGLFQGPQYTRNMLTFNPGWDRTGSPVAEFDDVRDIQQTLERKGLTLTAAADESSTGPASIVLTDPDGNPILIDQHVPRPHK